MSADGQDDDLPRDAWLREALRHAPDADAAPPPRLNETILRMGRAAVAPREERRAAPAAHSSGPAGDTVAVTHALAALWAWLARPPVAAGFAAVFLSTVVGVLWMGRPIEQAAAPQDDLSVAANAPAPSQTSAPAASPAPTAAAPKRGAPTEPAKSADAAPARKAEAPAPVPQSVPPAAPPAAVTSDNMAAGESSAARMAAPARAPAQAPAQAQAQVPAAAASAIETAALSNLRFEIRRRPEAWTWQRNEGEARPMDDAMQNWIAQADRTTHSAWQHGTGAGASSTTTLRFTRDDVVRAVLRLGPGGMQLTRGGKTESVALTPAQAAALQSSLDALGP